MIAGNVPNHLVVGARTGFLGAVNDNTRLAEYSRITREMQLDAASGTLVDIGSPPMPQEETGVPARDFIEKAITITPQNWTQLVWVSHNASKDDQTRMLEK